MILTIVVLLFPLALMYAGGRDLMSYEIPNWVSLAIVADFLALALLGPVDLSMVGWNLSAGAAVLIVGAALFFAGIMGGGDAKLLAACAVWVGWSGLLKFCFVVSIAGGVFALLIIAAKYAKLPKAWREGTWLGRLCSGEKGLPYGVAIGLGGIVMFRELPVVTATAGDLLSYLV